MPNNRITEHSALEYGSVTDPHGLETARQHLQAAKQHEPLDTWDAKRKAAQIEMLTDVVHKREAGIKALTARMRETEEHGASSIAVAADARKATTMEELRRAFAGSDADFERLSDRLYDEWLLSETVAAAGRPRATGA